MLSFAFLMQKYNKEMKVSVKCAKNVALRGFLLHIH